MRDAHYCHCFLIFSLDPLLYHLKPMITSPLTTAHESQISLTAFADYILLIVWNPHVTLMNLLQDIQDIGTLSGYYINLDKSEALLGQGPSKPNWTLNFPFHWCQSSITYLGTITTKSPVHLYKQNIIPYITTLENTLPGWRK